MTETPLPPQDQADLDSIHTLPEVTERSLLELWDKALEPIKEVAENPIPITVAHKVVASWPFLSFQDTALYHQEYHSILGECHQVLKDLLAEHPEALGWVGEKDAEENHEHYRDVLVAWHILLDQIEADWDAEDPESHITVAAVADARAFFFSSTGFAGHLDAIGFSLANDEFLAAVEEAKGE